jgi:hypothetical protein
MHQGACIAVDIALDIDQRISMFGSAMESLTLMFTYQVEAIKLVWNEKGRARQTEFIYGQRTRPYHPADDIPEVKEVK